MTTLKAEFDGRVFVPCQQVKLPVGTQVEVLLPFSLRGPTPDENREWQEILQEIASGPPAFPTVDEAMRHSRKRP